MEEIIVFGTTEYSYLLKEIIEKEKVAKVTAFTADEQYITESDIIKHEKSGYPLIPFDSIEEYYPPTKHKILNTIGYTKMNRIRETKSAEFIEKGYQLYTFISKNATILSNIDMNSGNVIMPGAYIGTNITMGKNNVIRYGSVLTHDIKLGSNIFIAAGSVIGGNVTIRNNSFLGLNCTVKNGIEIDKYSLIGAGAYINKDTDPCGVYTPVRTQKLNKSSLEIL